MAKKQLLYIRLSGVLSGLLLVTPNIYPALAFLQLAAFLPILYLAAVARVKPRYMLVAGLYMGLAYVVPQLITLRMPPLVALVLLVYLTGSLMLLSWGTGRIFAKPSMAGCLALGCFFVLIDWMNITVIPFWGTAQSFIRSWSRYPDLILFTSFTGMGGIIFALAVLKSLFVTSIFNVKLRKKAALIMVLFVSLLLGLNKAAIGRGPTSKIKVAAMGWTSTEYQDINSQRGFQTLFIDAVSQAAQEGAALIVFPETAFYMNGYDDHYILSLSDLASKHDIFLVSGYFNNPENKNKMLFMNSAGEIVSDYTKTHLTLFERDYKKGDGQMKTVDCHGICLGGMICHDDNFTNLSRSYGRNATGIVAVPTFDWANVKNAHLQNSIHRAIESRYGIVRATLNGISAIISPTGKILAQKDHLTQGPGLIIAEMSVYKCATFYSFGGNWFVLACLVYMGVYIFQNRKSLTKNAEFHEK